MAKITIEHKKARKKYKLVKEFDSTIPGHWPQAYKAYNSIQLVPEESKRMKLDGKKIKHLSCYYT